MYSKLSLKDNVFKYSNYGCKLFIKIVILPKSDTLSFYIIFKIILFSLSFLHIIYYAFFKFCFFFLLKVDIKIIDILINNLKDIESMNL